MSKAISIFFAASSALVLAACGGSSSSSNSTQAPANNNLADLLSTGANSSDTQEGWDCNGTVNQQAVNFILRLFADGNGSTTEDSDVALLTWSASSTTAIAVTFPAIDNLPEESFSLTDISFSAVNVANDRFDAIDSRDSSALACTKVSETNTSTGPTEPVSQLIVNSFTTVSDGVFEDMQWACDLAGSSATTSYEFNEDGSGRRFVPDFASFTDDPPAFTWTADDANNTVTVVNNGATGTLSSVQFSDNNTFTAVDSFISDMITCARSDIPNGPTPPEAPQPISSCPCSFEEALQFLTDQGDQSATTFVTNIAGGRLVDINTVDGALQLTVRDTGIFDCQLTSSAAGFSIANEVESLSSAQAQTCSTQLDAIINR